jgi:hypothetical protein
MSRRSACATLSLSANVPFGLNVFMAEQMQLNVTVSLKIYIGAFYSWLAFYILIPDV